MKYYQLSMQEQLLLVEAVVLLFITKLLVLFVPFRKLAPCFGSINKESGLHVRAEDLARIAKVRKTIMAASNNVPWKSVCLDQALVATIMLNRRNIPNTLFLGVKLNQEQSKLEAHAWVSCDDKIFIGGEQSKTFKVVACFSKW
jgi:hypothetical protein